MNLAIREYLLACGSREDLRTKFGIVAKRHGAHPNLVLFKYDQISSPFAEQIVRECRGIILDEADRWSVVSRSFDKFFNYGETLADPIDWSTARTQEKVDGSLITVYHYRGRWHAATTGSPDAGGAVYGIEAGGTWTPRRGSLAPAPCSFSEYFWQVLGLYSPSLFTGKPQDLCFLFELTGPLNRIVVPHEEARLTVLGARNRATGEEMLAVDAAAVLDNAVPHVREYDLQSFDDILATFSDLSPLAQEGYVIVDGSFRRVKVKHPGYVAIHHAKDGLSQRAFVEIAKSGEVPEVVIAFPELRPLLEDTKSRLDGLVREVESDYGRLRGIETQKDFAIQAVKTRCSAALFAMRAGKKSNAREFFADVHVDQLMRMLGYRAEASVHR